MASDTYYVMEALSRDLISVRLVNGEYATQTVKTLCDEVARALGAGNLYPLREFNGTDVYDWIGKLETAQEIDAIGYNRVQVIEMFKRAYDELVYFSGHPKRSKKG